jgi:hypothetical protein
MEEIFEDMLIFGGISIADAVLESNAMRRKIEHMTAVRATLTEPHGVVKALIRAYLSRRANLGKYSRRV